MASKERSIPHVERIMSISSSQEETGVKEDCITPRSVASCDDATDAEVSRKKSKPRTNRSEEQLQFAKDIVARYNQRGKKLPKEIVCHDDPIKLQEYKDAVKLKHWKSSLKGGGKGIHNCRVEVQVYLDSYMPEWRVQRNEVRTQLERAEDIVKNYRKRGNVFPRKYITCINGDMRQEHRDAVKLNHWKQSLKSRTKGSHNCPDMVRDFLDEHMTGWRNTLSSTNKRPRGQSDDENSIDKVIASAELPCDITCGPSKVARASEV